MFAESCLGFKHLSHVGEKIHRTQKLNTYVIFDICSLHVSAQVTGFIQKVHCPRPHLNDSLDAEIQAFLTEEDQLHTYDDLTKVSPVTPTTGTKYKTSQVID